MIWREWVKDRTMSTLNSLNLRNYLRLFFKWTKSLLGMIHLESFLREFHLIYKWIARLLSLDRMVPSSLFTLGAGKSTLIYLLTGAREPLSGVCHRHGRLRLGLFSQHHVDQLELGLSSAAFLAKQFPGQVEEEYRRVLGKFGLTGMTAMQPIGTLSGGQKSRVIFAAMSMMNPHVLVLDEPTSTSPVILHFRSFGYGFY